MTATQDDERRGQQPPMTTPPSTTMTTSTVITVSKQMMMIPSLLLLSPQEDQQQQPRKSSSGTTPSFPLAATQSPVNISLSPSSGDSNTDLSPHHPPPSALSSSCEGTKPTTGATTDAATTTKKHHHHHHRKKATTNTNDQQSPPPPQQQPELPPTPHHRQRSRSSVVEDAAGVSSSSSSSPASPCVFVMPLDHSPQQPPPPPPSSSFTTTSRHGHHHSTSCSNNAAAHKHRRRRSTEPSAEHPLPSPSDAMHTTLSSPLSSSVGSASSSSQPAPVITAANPLSGSLISPSSSEERLATPTSPVPPFASALPPHQQHMSSSSSPGGTPRSVSHDALTPPAGGTLLTPTSCCAGRGMIGPLGNVILSTGDHGRMRSTSDISGVRVPRVTYHHNAQHTPPPPSQQPSSGLVAPRPFSAATTATGGLPSLPERLDNGPSSSSTAAAVLDKKVRLCMDDFEVPKYSIHSDILSYVRDDDSFHSEQKAPTNSSEEQQQQQQSQQQPLVVASVAMSAAAIVEPPPTVISSSGTSSLASSCSGSPTLNPALTMKLGGGAGGGPGLCKSTSMECVSQQQQQQQQQQSQNPKHMSSQQRRQLPFSANTSPEMQPTSPRTLLSTSSAAFIGLSPSKIRAMDETLHLDFDPTYTSEYDVDTIPGDACDIDPLWHSLDVEVTPSPPARKGSGGSSGSNRSRWSLKTWIPKMSASTPTPAMVTSNSSNKSASATSSPASDMPHYRPRVSSVNEGNTKKGSKKSSAGGGREIEISMNPSPSAALSLLSGRMTLMTSPVMTTSHITNNNSNSSSSSSGSSNTNNKVVVTAIEAAAKRRSLVKSTSVVSSPVKLFNTEVSATSTSSPLQSSSIFEEPDSPSNILWNEPGLDGRRQIRGGTLSKLVQYLANENNDMDTDYITEFLLTHRGFTTSEELLDLLHLRFQVKKPKGMDADPGSFASIMIPIRLRCVNVLKTWILLRPDDFLDSKELTLKAQEFISYFEQHTVTAKNLRRLLDRAVTKEFEMTKCEFANVNPCPEPLIYEDMPLMNQPGFDLMHPEEVARQLCLIEYQLWKAIRPYEFMNSVWTTVDKEKQAPHVVAMIQASNRRTNWVITEILTQPEVGHRALMLARFIAVADKCLQLNNFNAVMEIIAALQSSAVFRLKRTWELLPAKTWVLWDSLQAFTKAEGNFKNYRDRLRSCLEMAVPCVPYLGIYLTYLTFLNDGNPRYIPGTKLINFNKWRAISLLVQEILQLQARPMNFKPVMIIQDFILHRPVEDEDTLFELSMSLEETSVPRKRTKEEAMAIEKMSREIFKGDEGRKIKKGGSLRLHRSYSIAVDDSGGGYGGVGGGFGSSSSSPPHSSPLVIAHASTQHTHQQQTSQVMSPKAAATVVVSRDKQLIPPALNIQ